MTDPALLETAIAFHQYGVTVLPVKADGTKAPGLQTWKQYQATPPSIEDIVGWWTNGTTDGVGILTGATSGNLEMVEFEGRAVAEGILADIDRLADDNGLTELIGRIIDGYCETTPSGGIHLLYRISDGVALRNTKLARRPATPDELAAKPAEKVKVLAETRGEGGFVVVAPSAGRTHPTGKAWTLTTGGPDTIANITTDERDMLWALIRMVDTEPPRDGQDDTGPIVGGATSGLRPGDDYNQRADWHDILTPHGWTRGWRMGSGYAWRRPGKDTPGISATTGQSTDGQDRLYVFTSSTTLPTEVPLSKFWVHAHYQHGGDLSAAARALRAEGYGDEPTQPVTYHDPRDPFADAPSHPLDGVNTAAAQAIGERMSAAIDTVLEQAGIDPRTIDPSPTAPSIGTLAKSEDGHSQALIAEYGHLIRYCHEQGRWYTWTGWKWEPQSAGGGIVREFAKAVARQYPDGDGWLTHKKKSLSNGGITACLALTATDHRIVVSIDDLDAHPWELNTPAGIIDLVTGQLGPARPDRLHTQTTAIAPDFHADITPWLAFLNTTFQGDQSMIDFIQRLLGYGLVGAVREAILPVFYGEGANGKTVLLETVQEILGDYATVAPQKFLVQGPNQHATEVAALAGKRFVIASETNEGERFDEAKVKILTGGDRIKARFMRQDEFTFRPSHLLVMMTNHRPEVDSGGTSFWRRLREVPFDNQIPEGKRDYGLRERLVAENGPAIMAWLARGAALYAHSGLAEPAGVKRATRTYEEASDSVARFADDCLLIGGGELVKVKTTVLRETYEQWCREEGAKAVSAKSLTQSLMKRYGVGKSRDMAARFYTNVSLIGNPETTHDRDPFKDS